MEPRSSFAFWSPSGRVTQRLVWAGMVGMAVVALVFGVARSQEDIRLQAAFQSVIHAHMREVGERVDKHDAMLLALHTLLQYAEGLDSKGFYAAAAEIQSRQPQLLALEWAPRVDRAARGDFERQLGTEGMSSRPIFLWGPGGERVPSPDREVYFPVRWTHPFGLNRERVGGDLASTPGFENGGEAVEKKDTLASQKGVFWVGGKSVPCIGVAVPVFEEVESSTPPEWESQAVGFFAGGVRPGEVDGRGVVECGAGRGRGQGPGLGCGLA